MPPEKAAAILNDANDLRMKIYEVWKRPSGDI
jgi:hypothetical protein